MIRNLIIVNFVLVIIYEVSSEDGFWVMYNLFDFLQQIVYNVKESGKL